VPGRDNGLEASSYAPLADLEPRLADAMLEALKDEGVAAYVVPATQHSSGLTMKEFRGPMDRLWVDSTAKSRAKQILDARLPGLRDEMETHASARDAEGAGGGEVRAGQDVGTATPDEQEAWAQIVASFNTTTADPVPRWPVLEDVEEAGDPDAGRRGRAPRAEGDPDEDIDDDGTGAGNGSAVATGTQEGTGADGAAAAGRQPRDEDHFVPPPPPPLPRTDPITKAAWVALLGGPVYLLLATILGISVGPWEAFLAAGAFVGGFVTLVARMGDRPPTDSGPDDGAVV
jgi:hypothetical protein